MTFVIMLTLDTAGAESVRSLRRKMSEAGLPVDIDDPPHISLASCVTIDIDATLAEIEEIAQLSPALKMSLESAGSFLSDEGTVFLAPVVDDDLRNIQQRAMSIIERWGRQINPYYASGRWVAHCTIANRLTVDERMTALRLCAESSTTIGTRGERLDLVEFGDGAAIIHGSFLLGAVAADTFRSVISLHHAQITIPSGQEQRGREFYCKLLGLPEIEKPVSLAGRGGFWLRVGDRTVHVGTEPNVDRSVTKAHLAYSVTGLAAWRQALVEHGLDIIDGEPIPGYNRFEFRDPFGNRVEMIEPISPVM